MASTSISSEEEAWENVREVVGKGDQATINQCYTKWNDYEKDMAALSYHAPTEAANRVMSWVPDKGSRILDFGCGTGLVADLLHDNGYTNMHGVDPVEKMIETCTKKGTYTSATVLEIDPVTKIPFQNDYFEAVVSSGVFGKGGAGGDISPYTEIVRVLRPGGFFVNFIRESNWEYRRKDELNQKEVYDKLCADGVLSMRSRDKCDYYKTSTPLPGMVLVVEKI
nr:methyltransferase-like protein 27 [Lytechinus pictus]